jgi:hypothetical protein
VLLGKALSSGCEAKRQAKRLLLIAILNEREFVCGRICKIVDTTDAFRLVVYVCVASKCEWLTFFYVHMPTEMQTARRCT